MQDMTQQLTFTTKELKFMAEEKEALEAEIAAFRTKPTYEQVCKKRILLYLETEIHAKEHELSFYQQRVVRSEQWHKTMAELTSNEKNWKKLINELTTLRNSPRIAKNDRDTYKRITTLLTDFEKLTSQAGTELFNVNSWYNLYNSMEKECGLKPTYL